MTEKEHSVTRSIPVLVLDTHVILEAWVFGNPDSIYILEAVSARALHWITNREMREEMIHVLGRGLGPRWPTHWDMLRDRWESLATECPADGNKPAHWPRCTDADDQKFIDLALQKKARWLISRDRAVLKTASRCARLGLTVVDPTRWRAIWSNELNSRA